MTGHIFISYARRDGANHAATLEDCLAKLRFTTWRDQRGINPTQDFTSEIERAIEDSAYVIACITADTRRDDSFVRREIAYAQLSSKPVIVARFDDVKPPISIINLTWIDFFKGWDNAFHHLCQLLNSEIPLPVVPAPSLAPDPFKPYLDALYRQIVRYLDRTVFSMGQTSLIPLVAEITPDAVRQAPVVDSLPLVFFDIAGVENYFDDFQKAVDHYDGRILLLGEPGAGKTTTLFAFARDAVARRLQDASQPLPVLLPVATWDTRTQPPVSGWIHQMIQQLTPEILQGRLLLLLDGLDELGEKVIEKRPDQTLHEYDPRVRFVQQLPADHSIVISCRVKDYQVLVTQSPDSKLSLNGAVTLQPLNDAQMRRYLHHQPHIWEMLRHDDQLREMAQTPLLLSLFTFAFSGLEGEAAALRNLSQVELRDRIFATYLRKRYEHEQRKLRADLPFSLENLDLLLGMAAFGDVEKRHGEHNLLDRGVFMQNIPEELIDRFITFAVKLNILIPVDKQNFRFIHLLLRDYFAANFAIHILNSPTPLTIDLGASGRTFGKINAVNVLGALHDKRATGILIQHLENAAGNVKFLSAIATALGKIGSEESVPVLIDLLLNDAWHNVRRDTAAVLGLELPSFDLDWRVRLEVARVIRKRRDAVDEGWIEIRRSATAALGEIGSPLAIEPLLYTIADLDWRLRLDAVKALSNFRHDDVTEGLILALTDPDADVRRVAAAALGTQGDLQAVEPLIDSLNDQDPAVRVKAALALGALQDTRAAGALSRLLGDNRRGYVQTVAQAAAAALHQMGMQPISR